MYIVHKMNYFFCKTDTDSSGGVEADGECCSVERVQRSRAGRPQSQETGILFNLVQQGQWGTGAQYCAVYTLYRRPTGQQCQLASSARLVLPQTDSANL